MERAGEKDAFGVDTEDPGGKRPPSLWGPPGHAERDTESLSLSRVKWHRPHNLECGEHKLKFGAIVIMKNILE